MIVRLNSLIVCLFMLVSLSAVGQIGVVIECDNDKYIVGEAVMAKVVVENNVEVPLVFDKSYHNAELEVCVSRDRASARIPFVGSVDREFVIMPNESAAELVDVGSLVDLNVSGSFQVKARVRYEGLLFTSQSKGIDIVRGVEIVSRKRSLSGYSLQLLTYSLRYISRNKSEYVFLVVKDENGTKSYGTIRLGPIVRVMQPTINFDDDGQVIIVHQSGRKRFTRSVIAVHNDGSDFVEQTHHQKNGSLF